jgi:hypothetical protein
MTITQEDQSQVRAHAEQHILELSALHLGDLSEVIFQNQPFRFSAVTADMEDVRIVLQQRRADVREPERWFFLYLEPGAERCGVNRAVDRLNFF